MAYNFPLNNPGGVHLAVFDFTYLSHPPTKTHIILLPLSQGPLPPTTSGTKWETSVVLKDTVLLTQYPGPIKSNQIQ